MKKQLKFLFLAFLLLTVGTITHTVYATATPVAVLSNDKKTLTFLNAVKTDATSATDSSGTVYSGTVYRDIERGAAQSSDPSDIADTQDEYLNGNDYRSYKDAAKTVTKIVIKDKLSLKTDAFAFADFTKLTEIEGLKNLDATSSMAGFVYGDSELIKLDMSDIDMTNVTSFAYSFSKTDKLAAVAFGKTNKPVNFFHAFEDAKAVTTLDLSGMSFSNLNHAFSGASSLTSVTLPDKFGAKNMAYLFNNAEKLNTLDGSKFDTSNATDLSYAFNGTSSLLKLDTSSWDLSKATSFNHFANGSAVSSIDFSKAKIVSGDFTNAFSANKHLTSLDLSGVVKVTGVASLVSGDSQLRSVKVPFDTSSVTDFSKVFYGTGLTSLNLSQWDTSKAKTMNLMFASSNDLEKVTFGKNFVFKDTALPTASIENGFTGKWHSSDGTNYTASEMAALSSGKLEGTWHWSGEDRRTAYYAIVTDDSLEVIKGLMSTASKDKVTDADSGKVYKGKVYNLAEVLDGSKVPWAGNTAIKTAAIHAKYYFGEHADYFFAGLSNLTKINGLEKLDFTHTLTATHFFDGAGLTTLDATVWDDGTNPATTSNIKDASYFFANMSNLTNLTIVASSSKYGATHSPVFDLRSATNLSHLFENDSKITSLVLSECIDNYWHYYGLKASDAVQNTAYMFAGMSNVTSIWGFRDDNGNFSNVIDATAMFKGDSKLTDFGTYAYTGSYYWENSFRFSKIQKADEMFAGVGFKTLDLGRFNGSNLTSAKNMFKGDSITRFLDSEGKFTMNGFDFEDATAIDSNYSGNWVNDKNNKTYTPAEMKTYKGVFDLIPELITDDGEKQTDLSGTAYAVLDGKTLKFIRSKARPKDGTIKGIDGITYKGTIYTDFENSTSIPWRNDNFTTVKFINAIRPTTVNSWFNNKANLVQVIGGQNLNLSRVTDMFSMFDGDTKLVRVNTSDWNTSLVTTMEGMFRNCQSLTNLNVSNWNTSNVTDMIATFQNCQILTNLDVSKWDTRKVTDMGWMFNGCSNLTNLDVSKWDTSHVINMGTMFAECHNLVNLNVSKWDTSKVTNMFFMFTGCKSLTNLDVSKWDTSKVTDMHWMFANCPSLANLDVSKWDTGKVKDMNFMFQNCHNLANLDVSKWDTSQVTDMNSMFALDSSLANLDVSKWDTSKVTNMLFMFQNCASFTNLDVSKWDTSKVTNMGWMFQNCQILTNLDVSKWDTGNATTMSGMFQNCFNLANLDVSKWNTGNVTNMGWMFNNCSNFANLDVSKWDTNQVIDMHSMFQNCQILTNLDVSKWDTSNVINMGWMFQNCTKLTALGDLSDWNVSNVQDSSNMFANDKSLTNADVHKWKLANVANVAYMFSHCENLPNSNVSGIAIGSKNKTLDHTFADCYALSDFDASNIDTSNVLSLNTTFGQNNYDNNVAHMKIKSITGLDKWDTSQVTNMHQTFKYDRLLTDLDLSNWNTKNVTDMSAMFQGAGLKKLDLSNFKGDKVTNVDYMLCDMPNVTEIDLSKYDTPNLTSAIFMFYDDPNLKSALIGKLDLRNVNAIGVVRFFNKDTNLSTVDLGPKWKFMTAASDWDKATTENSNMLENVPTTGDYDGTWNDEYTSLDLAKSWNSSMQNVYSWTVENADPNSHVYAVYNNGTLTFIRTTEKPTLNTDNISVDSTNGNTYTGRIFKADGSWHSLNSQIKTVSLTTKVKPLSTNSWFAGCTNLTSVKNAQRFDMSNNTDMGSMFNGCSNLTNLEVSNWDTSKVTAMYGMFHDCSKIANLDVSKWDTGKVTNMNSMFSGCSNLANLNVSKWDTSKVTTMGWMFQNCSSLANLDVSNWNTSKVTDMSGMFYSCSNLSNLDVSKWDTSNATGMGWMFDNCSNLASVGDLSNWNTTKATSMREMFLGCSNLANLDVSNWNTSNVTTMYWMFGSCSNLANLDVSKWDTSKVTNMNGMFGNCSNLANLDVSKWNTSKVTNMSGMFYGCSNLTNLDVSKWDTSKATSISGMFINCSNLANLDVSKWDTSKVTDMSWIFGGCSSLANLDVSKWNTSKATDISGMFDNCFNLANLDVSKWDTSNATGMGWMFDNCSNLANLDVSKWNTSKATYMREMFNGCSNFANLDLSKWDTSKVTNSDYMFSGTTKLQSLTLGSKFNINSTNTGLADDFNKRDSSLYSKWVRTSDDMIKSSNDLMTMDASQRVGTWVAKKMTAAIDITDSNKKTVLESAAMDNYKTIADKWAHHGYTIGTSNVPPALDPYAPSYKMTYTVYMDPKSSTYSVSTTTPKGTYMFKNGKQVGTKTVNLTIIMNGGAYFNFSKMNDVVSQVMGQTPAGWHVESTKYAVTDGYGDSKTINETSGSQGGYTVVYSVEFSVDQDKVTKNYGEFVPVLPTDRDSYDVISGGSVKITLPDVYNVTSLATRTAPYSSTGTTQDTVYAFYKLAAVRTGNHSMLGNLTFTDGETGGNGSLDGESVGNYVTVHMPIDWSHANSADSYKWYESHMSFEYVNNYDNPDMAVVDTDDHTFDVTWYKHNPILFDDTKPSKQRVPYSQINILGDDSKSFDTITLHNTYSFLQNSGEYLTAKAGYGIEYPYQVMQKFYAESGNDNNEESRGHATTNNLYDDILTPDINHEKLHFHTSSKQLHDVPTNTSSVFAQLNAKYGSLFYPIQFQTLTNITARSKSLKNGFQTYADDNDLDHRYCDYIKDNVKTGIYPLNINADIGEVAVNKNFKIQIYGSRMASKDGSDGEINIDGTLSGTTSNTTDKLKNRYGITDKEAEQLKKFLKN